MRGRPGKTGKEAERTTGKTKKNTMQSFKNRAVRGGDGCEAGDPEKRGKSDGGKPEIGEKGEAENRERKNERRKNREREKSEAVFEP